MKLGLPLFAGAIWLAVAAFAAVAGESEPWSPGAYGPDMMHGYPGMMHGYGHGPMTGGFAGTGPGMMAGIWALDLTAEQRTKIGDIMAEQQREQFQRMGRMREAVTRLRELYGKEPWDAEAIGEAYGRLFEVRREAIESQIRARNRVFGLLTEQQRQQLRTYSGRRSGGRKP